MILINNTYKKYSESEGNARIIERKGNANFCSGNAYTKYQQNSVYTSSPQDLTLMLYNGLVKFLNLAIREIEEKSVEKANSNIIRSQEIIDEFICTLDMDYEVSKGLAAIYDYMNRQLIEANIKKDKQILEEVRGYAEELRDTWAAAMKVIKERAAE